MKDVVTIHQIPIANFLESEFFEYFRLLIPRPAQQVIFFANAHSCNVAHRDKQFLTALQDADLVLPDGIGLKIAGTLMGHPVKANLNGTDLLPKVLAVAAESGLGVFLLGGEPGVAHQARARLVQTHPGLNIVGVHHGFFAAEEHHAVLAAINASGADLLIVALGVPLQEKWIMQYRHQLQIKFLFGVGAFLDFSAGRVARAPRVLRDHGLEWLFRLYLEPRRLFFRYGVGNITFLARTIVAAVSSRM